MPRITGHTTMLEAIVQLSDLNIDCPRILAKIIADLRIHDPSNVLGPLGPLQVIDELELYGDKLQTLFDSKCSGSSRLFLLLIKSYQLGYVPGTRLQALAMDKQQHLTPSEWRLIDNKVTTTIRDFSKATGEAGNGAG